MGNKTSSVIRVLNIPKDPERPPQNLENPYSPNIDSTNMPIQFSGCLPKRLEEDDTICLQGMIAEGVSEFTIALVSIDNYAPDIENVAYYHKINLEDCTSVINHKINGNWQEEVPIDAFDIRQVYVAGSPFSVKLIIKEDSILVYCNGQYTTSHGVPLQVSLQSTHIQIWNGLEKVDSMTVEFA